MLPLDPSTNTTICIPNIREFLISRWGRLPRPGEYVLWLESSWFTQNAHSCVTKGGVVDWIEPEGNKIRLITMQGVMIEILLGDLLMEQTFGDKTNLSSEESF